MGSSKGGSDTDDAKVPKLEEEGEGEEKQLDAEKVDDLIDLGLIDADLDELVAAAPAVTAAAPPPPPPPPPQQQPPAVNYHKLPMVPLGNPKAKHCYDK